MNDRKLKTQLTASELKLCHHLFSGLSLRKSAKSCAISYENARTKLKKIFEKTEVSSQAQLVLYLSHNPYLNLSVHNVDSTHQSTQLLPDVNLNDRDDALP